MTRPKYIIGIDPDSHAHGVSIYTDGLLTHLKMWNTVELVEFLKDGFVGQCLVSMENVVVNKFIYSRNQHSNKSVQSSIAIKVGRNQQSQIELMRWLDHIGVDYVLHKPQPGNWAGNAKMFQMATGWPKSGNKDTRSAAYFGHLAI